MDDPLVKIRQDLTPPNGRDYWTELQEYGAPPTFTTLEVAVVFFARGKIWLQQLLNGHDPRVDDGGVDIEIPKWDNGYFQFQLHHVELISHYFLAHGIIDLNTFVNSISIIRAIAQNYRLL